MLTLEQLTNDSFDLRNEFFSKKSKIKKNIYRYIYYRIETGETQSTSRFSYYMVVIFVPQLFMRQCSYRFCYSRSHCNESFTQFEQRQQRKLTSVF